MKRCRNLGSCSICLSHDSTCLIQFSWIKLGLEDGQVDEFGLQNYRNCLEHYRFDLNLNFLSGYFDLHLNWSDHFETLDCFD